MSPPVIQRDDAPLSAPPGDAAPSTDAQVAPVFDDTPLSTPVLLSQTEFDRMVRLEKLQADVGKTMMVYKPYVAPPHKEVQATFDDFFVGIEGLNEAQRTVLMSYVTLNPESTNYTTMEMNMNKYYAMYYYAGLPKAFKDMFGMYGPVGSSRLNPDQCQAIAWALSVAKKNPVKTAAQLKREKRAREAVVDPTEPGEQGGVPPALPESKPKKAKVFRPSTKKPKVAKPTAPEVVTTQVEAPPPVETPVLATAVPETATPAVLYATATVVPDVAPAVPDVARPTMGGKGLVTRVEPIVSTRYASSSEEDEAEDADEAEEMEEA